MRHELSDYDAVGARKRVLFTFTAVCCSPDAEPGPWLVGVCSDMEIRPPSMGLSASRRYVSTEAGVYSSLDARATVRVSLARDLLTRPACGRPNARTRRLHHPRHVASLHVPSRRRRTWGGLCDLAPGVRRRTNATGALRRRADAAARETRRIQFARALASQRPPSRERPPLGGGGAGRALSLSLCLSPRSRSIDDAEHRLRQVRGPPACSSAGT